MSCWSTTPSLLWGTSGRCRRFFWGGRDQSHPPALIGVCCTVAVTLPPRPPLPFLHPSPFRLCRSVLHIHTIVEECEVTKLLYAVDMKTKEQKKVCGRGRRGGASFVTSIQYVRHVAERETERHYVTSLLSCVWFGLCALLSLTQQQSSPDSLHPPAAVCDNCSELSVYTCVCCVLCALCCPCCRSSLSRVVPCACAVLLQRSRCASRRSRVRGAQQHTPVWVVRGVVCVFVGGVRRTAAKN